MSSSSESVDCYIEKVVEPLKSAPKELPKCKICGEKGHGFHYGAITCEACKKFFMRSIRPKTPYHCDKQKNCVVLRKKRTACLYCRFQKCLDMGMTPENQKRLSRKKPVPVPELGNENDVMAPAPDQQYGSNTLEPIQEVEYEYDSLQPIEQFPAGLDTCQPTERIPVDSNPLQPVQEFQAVPITWQHNQAYHADPDTRGPVQEFPAEFHRQGPNQEFIAEDDRRTSVQKFPVQHGTWQQDQEFPTDSNTWPSDEHFFALLDAWEPDQQLPAEFNTWEPAQNFPAQHGSWQQDQEYPVNPDTWEPVQEFPVQQDQQNQLSDEQFSALLDAWEPDQQLPAEFNTWEPAQNFPAQHGLWQQDQEFPANSDICEPVQEFPAKSDTQGPNQELSTEADKREPVQKFSAQQDTSQQNRECTTGSDTRQTVEELSAELDTCQHNQECLVVPDTCEPNQEYSTESGLWGPDQLLFEPDTEEQEQEYPVQLIKDAIERAMREKIKGVPRFKTKIATPKQEKQHVQFMTEIVRLHKRTCAHTEIKMKVRDVQPIYFLMLADPKQNRVNAWKYYAPTFVKEMDDAINFLRGLSFMEKFTQNERTILTRKNMFILIFLRNVRALSRQGLVLRSGRLINLNLMRALYGVLADEMIKVASYIAKLKLTDTELVKFIVFVMFLPPTEEHEIAQNVECVHKLNAVNEELQWLLGLKMAKTSKGIIQFMIMAEALHKLDKMHSKTVNEIIKECYPLFSFPKLFLDMFENKSL